MTLEERHTGSGLDAPGPGRAIRILARAAPLALFPFSKLVWLAFDVMFRPVTPAELEWHRTTDENV